MYQKSDPKTIQNMFGSIAHHYDKTNSALSFGLHKKWNRKLAKVVSDSSELVDLCCGTGEVAFAYLKRKENSSRVYLIDFCKEMLDCASKKGTLPLFEKHQLTYIQADVQCIPLDEKSVSAATMAYGIRNVKDPFICMKDVFRILKPGGVFAILELTQPNQFFLKWGHTLYLNTLLPVVGKMLASNREAYQYLCQSIQQFIKPKEIETLLIKAGFEKTSIHRLNAGIATIIVGKRPNA